jgi:quercetin dioxygenase-like cupin family protein
MNLTRFSSAPSYTPAPDHHGMACLRLQGLEAGPSSTLWMGVSRIEPGGGITPGASPLEKLYIVLEGHVTVVTETGEATLGPWDSVRLAPGETRALENRTAALASILLAMPLPAPEKI